MRKIDLIERNLLSKIHKTTIFQYLDDDERAQLLKIVDILEYRNGEKVVVQGEVSSCFYAVVSGNLNVTVTGENGKEIQVSSISEGNFFGETGIFTDGQRTANVIANDTVQVLRFGRNDFFTFLRNHPKTGVKLLMLFVHGLMNRLNAANKEIVDERDTLSDKILFFEKPE